MSDKAKQDSPLVAAVLALEGHLSELERVGQKISAADLTGDVDLEYIQKLMNRFAECGEGIAKEVTTLSLSSAGSAGESARRRAKSSRQAEAFNNRKKEQDEKLLQFRMLGDKVREIKGIVRIKPGPGREVDRRSLLGPWPAHSSPSEQRHSSSGELPPTFTTSSCLIRSTLNFTALAMILSSVWSKSNEVAFENRV